MTTIIIEAAAVYNSYGIIWCFSIISFIRIKKNAGYRISGNFPDSRYPASCFPDPDQDRISGTAYPVFRISGTTLNISKFYKSKPRSIRLDNFYYLYLTEIRGVYSYLPHPWGEKVKKFVNCFPPGGGDTINHWGRKSGLKK